MIEICIHKSGNLYFLPTTWEELSPKQFLFFVKTIHTIEDVEKAKMMLLKEWANISDADFTGYANTSLSRKRIINNMMMQQYIQLLSELNIFFDSVSFGKNLYPTIDLPHISLIGPADNLANVTANELDKAYYFLDMYYETEELNYLKSFVACLWRKPAKDAYAPGHPLYKGDIRTPFNENNIQYDAILLDSVDSYILHACRYVFNNNLKFLAEQPNWERTFKSNAKDSGERTQTDWNKIFRSIASDKRGTLDDIKKLSIIEVFDELEYLEAEREAIELSKK